MSSNPRVIRRPPSATLFNPGWDKPELEEGHVRGPVWYHAALGVVVCRFNGLETYLQSLAAQLCGLHGSLGQAIFTHVGSNTLIESIRAIKNDYIEETARKEEIEFCAELFDKNRINRNFLVHGAREVMPIGPPYDELPLQKRSARNKIKIEEWDVNLDTIESTADEIHQARQFMMAVIGPLCHYDGGDTLTLPERPPLPKLLAQSLPKVDPFSRERMPTSPA